jgi:outer membrane protein TolC
VGLARRLFEAGRGGPADVSDAEDAARAAADRRIEVRARAVVDGYALLRASGSLVESPPELRPGVGPEGPPPEDPP